MPEKQTGISPQDLFENMLPGMFKMLSEVNPIPDMEGTEFTMQVKLGGEGGATYGVTIMDAREMEVHAGTLERPKVALEIPEAGWKKALAALGGGALPAMPEGFDPAMLAPNRGVYDAMQDISGTLVFEVLSPDGDPVNIKLTLNGEEKPCVTMSATAAAFKELAMGDPAQLPRAFMAGRIKIDGDMSLMMRLGAVMAQNLSR